MVDDLQVERASLTRLKSIYEERLLNIRLRLKELDEVV